MYIIIRGDVNEDVLGILNESIIRDPSDMNIESYSYAVYDCIDHLVMDSDLMDIISADLGGFEDWGWERITQAEYETYRDLHEFHVIK